MKLNKKEKHILTFAEEIPTDAIADTILLYFPYKRIEITKILRKLLLLELITIKKIKDKTWYMHTKKVTEDMLDKELQYQLRYAQKKLVLKAKESLEKKLGAENYQKKGNRIIHVKEFECLTCHSRSTEPILCCNTKMAHTLNHTDKDCKGCC